MATVKQYIDQAWTIEKQVAAKYGVDLPSESKTVRVLAKATLAIICVIVKLLVDKGVFTNAELSAAFTAAGADLYDDEPV